MKTRYQTFIRIAAVSLVVTALGCGGSRSTKGDDGLLDISGRVEVGGSSPFALVTIETMDGKIYGVTSNYLSEELRQMSGMNVRVEAVPRTDFDGDVPFIQVRWYELLRFSSGERPVVGIIRAGRPGPDALEQFVYLIDSNDVQWIIEGTFRNVLAGFDGSKVWVAGVVQAQVTTGRGAAKTILVSEYGIIRQY